MCAWHVVWFYANRFGYKSAEHKAALARYRFEGYASTKFGEASSDTMASALWA